ncbi:MAG: FAD-binding oxidoreductase [Flavobacteriales bacterium]|jgi:glycine/D-amino acid oxidase-like deaminating enzyme
MNPRIIIIGQGIAGSLLAYELMKAGRNVMVIDNGYKTSASRIAAGMWNPILFKKLKKSWRADDLLPALHRTYTELEELLDKKFIYDREIVRLFPSNDAANDFHLAAGDERYSDYLEDKPQPEVEAVANDEFGYGTIKGGYVDLPVFLPAFREYLKSKDSFLESEFNESDIQFNASGVCWNGYEAQKIIFANGFKTIESAYWNYLPLTRTHGNLLHVQAEGLNLKGVFNNGQWLLHQADGSYKMGATFEWHLLEPTPSEEARQKLLDKLESGLKEKPELDLIQHHAGIRPTTADHRPVMGFHADHPAIGIFNGMGTKGVMLAPFFARQFSASLTEKSAIEDVVHVNRFRNKTKG